jgi:hypothetical protein
MLRSAIAAGLVTAGALALATPAFAAPPAPPTLGLCGVTGAVLPAGCTVTAAATPSAAVDPDTALSDGQVVQVTATGFPAGDSLVIVQCDADPGGEGDCDTNNTKFVTATSSGSVPPTRFTVHDRVGSDNDPCDSTHACSIQVSEPSLSSTHNAHTTITFAGTAGPTTTATPTAGSDTTPTTAAATTDASASTATPSEGPASAAAGGLPQTGAPHAPLEVAIGLALIAAGAAALTAERRLPRQP